MASRILNITNSLRNSFRNLSIGNELVVNAGVKCNPLQSTLLQTSSIQLNAIRHGSFFNKVPASWLWKSVTSVSNAGKKRGRGQRINARLIRDLNKGQFIGHGRANIVWPGLNAPIIKGRDIVQQKQLPPDPEWQTNLIKIRDQQNTRAKRYKLNPLERGWSGSKMAGRKLGPPEPIGESTFNGWETIPIQSKRIKIMRGSGRQYSMTVSVVLGNKNGSIGFAEAHANEQHVAFKKAQQRAVSHIITVPICNGHTVYHDFHCQFGNTELLVSPKPKGYGLKCHRVVKAMCEVIGITDLWVKHDGGQFPQNIAKAFFMGLLQQKNYQQLAEEKGLYVVEMRKDTNYYPKVVGIPSTVRTQKEIEPFEDLDFKTHCLQGRILKKWKKLQHKWYGGPTWGGHLKRAEKRRNHDNIRYASMLKYGEVRSFLTDKYPECIPPPAPEKREK